MFCFSKKVEFLKVKDVLSLTSSAVLNEDLELLERKITNVAPIGSAKEGEITFYANPKYSKFLASTGASFCFVKKDDIPRLNGTSIAIINQNPYFAFAQILTKFYGANELENPSVGFIAPSAVIAPSAQIGKNVTIKENVVIFEGAIIKDGVIIMPNAFIGSKVTIGTSSVIHDNASLMYCTLGEACVVRSGARIGTSGFGFAPNLQNGNHSYIPQISSVIIGNRVDIGANATVDRGCLESTIIEDDVKIDNLVQIGHGAKIGKSTFIAAQSGIAGSSAVGKLVFMGAQVGVAGHVSIADFTQIVGQSGIISDVKTPGQVLAGTPAVLKTQWERMHIKLKNILFKKS